VRLERGAFERAVLAYGSDPVELPGDLVEAGRASLDSTGLFLVGELHGASENPRVILALARELGTRALALEWSQRRGRRRRPAARRRR
jgi:hypothetical protein